MNIGAVNNSALLGIQRGFDNMNRDAAKIASATAVSAAEAPAREDLTRTLVGLQENSSNVQASTKAFSTQNRMLGMFLDEVA
ncbi:MAG: hypothetical protein H7842_05365 [Gammaproteobacteria bacterium SHHR-1]|uniref:hypothetical protein n=1 Tax=Magnetovirga frankeli TaxID=947516 RepID=UPI001292D530|nr:hypothetical protein D5125_01380 [gamma proteobacterium SS-5]